MNGQLLGSVILGLIFMSSVLGEESKFREQVIDENNTVDTDTLPPPKGKFLEYNTFTCALKATTLH